MHDGFFVPSGVASALELSCTNNKSFTYLEVLIPKSFLLSSVYEFNNYLKIRTPVSLASFSDLLSAILFGGGKKITIIVFICWDLLGFLHGPLGTLLINSSFSSLNCSHLAPFLSQYLTAVCNFIRITISQAGK